MALSTLVFAASACSAHDPEARTIQFHVPASCGANLPSAYLDVYGLGDFEATAGSPGTARFYASAQSGTLDGLPTSSRMLKTAASTLGDPFTFYGVAPVPSPTRAEQVDVFPDVHMLLLPTEASCKLTGALGARTGGAVGAAGDGVALVVGGTSADGRSVPRSFVVDLARGRVSRMASGLATPRENATVTPFGAGALVAGGLDPETRAPLGSAEIYAPNAGSGPTSDGVGDFKGAPLALAIPRGDHAAVRLRSGETLLVGGLGATGLPRTMEVLDPVTLRARTSGVALLATPRRAPLAMVLASGEVFVAGGTDEKGAPVPILEWFTADGSAPSRRPRALVATKARAFVPLFGGGALAVVARGDGTGNVWRITGDGDVELAGDVKGLPDDFVLLPSTDDGPLLFGGGVWRKFDVWSSRFLETTLPLEGPDARALLVSAALGADPSAASTAYAGLVSWLDANGVAHAFRATTKNAYDRVPRPLLVNGPEGFVPDRSPSKERYAFSGERGLALAADVTAMLADYTFEDFALDYDVSGDAGAVMPHVVLRLSSGAEIDLGRDLCVLPTGKHVHIERQGTRIVGMATSCSLPASVGEDDRVAIGFRGAASGVAFARGIKNLIVTR